ncbi:hypothetical protein H0H93_000044 [Arthromyces matolae]|nr:hypothetical protein H0H93_000044 [Arthromyces matolae]
MDSIIELQRQNHEELERFERGLSSLLSRNQASHESRLQIEHKASQILDRIQSRVLTLNSLYQDEGARKAEIGLLSAPSQQNDLSEFYSRLVKIQEHHAKYPDSVPGGGFDLEIAALLDEPNQEDEEYEDEDPISLLFSGEEAYGKYVDLYANHAAYCNLKNIGKRPGYLQYLDLLLAAQSGPIHDSLPKEARFSKDYETYIQNLYTYLLSFSKRTQPLRDLETQQHEVETEFNRQWEGQEISGWEESKPQPSVNGNGSTGIWCAACQKQYAKQTVYDAHLTSKKHIKAAAKQDASDVPPPNPNGTPTPSIAPSVTKSAISARIRNSAKLTHLVTSLLVSLTSTLNDTKSNVERRFSLTAREREQELEEQAKPPPPPPAATEGQEEEEEEEERIYNPLKLPLGWDGKPIPYWLYKLHGLGVEYRCEICSDHVYMGRHAFGMRALGLPNTKHFHEITRIEDALARVFPFVILIALSKKLLPCLVAEKLKQEGRHEIFEQETMEELEDDEGNVYNRKTYEDLKKQGLI